MTADRWTRAVRDQLGLGRLLPLGGPRDGAWIAESAAEVVLRRAVGGLAGVRLGVLRIAPADPEGGYEPAVPAPPSALPPGPLRVTAGFAAEAAEPLPAIAARLRTALATVAAERLGLEVAEVDLRVTALLDRGEEDTAGREPQGVPGGRVVLRLSGAAGEGDEARVAAAVLAVPGVTGLTAALGRAVRIEARRGGTAAALSRSHARVEFGVGADHRALDVAREVRGAVAEVLRDQQPTVAVLVTAVS
ncbi:nucleopolyhedrovirus P10 family protein [Streptomyces sp. NPDC003247]|uniref:nucleopolyhedrovirus P10 family protein n=1 Tax=Streptomyces sp. NPDC003247 TaxID=3364677 RepID=UPI0036819A28